MRPIINRHPAAGQSSPTNVRTRPKPQPAESPQAPDERQIAEWLSILIDPGQVVELRAPKTVLPGSTRPSTIVRYFLAGQLVEMAREAMRISGHAPAVYFTLNPVRADLAGGRRSARDEDIIDRRRLLIDCDPKRPPGTSATDAEKAAALETANAVRDHLTARGWPVPILADSGNGYHLIYAIDLPNDDVSRDLVKAMLVSLAEQFSTADVEIDRAVSNASRVVKLYGTAACKGEATADRPHRLSHVLEIPGAFTPVPRELCEALAGSSATTAPGASQATTAQGPEKPRRDAGPTTGDGTTIPLSERIERGRKLLNACEPAVSGEHGNDKLFKVACHVGPGLDLPPDVALSLLREDYSPKCLPPWSEDELRHKVDDVYRIETRRGFLLEAPRTRVNGKAHNGPDLGRNGTSEPPHLGGTATPPPTNGRGDAPRVVDDSDIPVNEAPDDPHRLARAVLAHYSHRDGPTLAWYRQEFHAWNGSCYATDETLPLRIVELVKGEIDRQNRAALLAYREQAESDVLAPPMGRPTRPPVATKVTRRLVLDVSQALASMVRVFDQDEQPPFWIRRRHEDPEPSTVLPASNGLVDLAASGGPALLPHTPRFFSTHALPYPYKPAAAVPTTWLQMLIDCWGDDAASIRELQKWFGYCLTPDIEQQRILLLVGSPGSGRSTIKDVLSHVIGRRNVVSTSAVALADRFGLEPFMGKTLAILGDARTGDTHDTAVMMDRLLRISGGDTVEVNRKGKPILQEVLMYTRLVIVSNEMPNFRDSSKAIVRRYLPLCTPRSFEGNEDRTILARLKKELPGLLNWSIDGRGMLSADGRFIVPPASEDLISEAKALASPVSEFVAEECVLGPDQDATVDEVWKRWKEWAERSGHQPSHRHLFGRNLRAATGFKIKVGQAGNHEARFRVYKGIGLKSAIPSGVF